jgi:hypothetical protein
MARQQRLVLEVEPTQDDHPALEETLLEHGSDRRALQLRRLGVLEVGIVKLDVIDDTVDVDLFVVLDLVVIALDANRISGHVRPLLEKGTLHRDTADAERLSLNKVEPLVSNRDEAALDAVLRPWHLRCHSRGEERKMKKLMFIAMMGLMIALPSLAQQERGDGEFQLQGSLNLGISGDVDDSGTINLLYGRFLTEHQEVGGTIGTFINSSGDWSGFGGPFYRYNFTNDGKLVPYAGGALTATFGDFSQSDYLLSLEGGARYFVNRNTAFTVAGTYYYDVDASEFADYLQVLFGFSYVWNK